MVHRAKIKMEQKSKMETSQVFLDVIRIGIDLEKVFWTVEIEIYRLVRSDGSEGENQK